FRGEMRGLRCERIAHDLGCSGGSGEQALVIHQASQGEQAKAVADALEEVAARAVDGMGRGEKSKCIHQDLVKVRGCFLPVEPRMNWHRRRIPSFGVAATRSILQSPDCSAAL